MTVSNPDQRYLWGFEYAARDRDFYGENEIKFFIKKAFENLPISEDPYVAGVLDGRLSAWGL